MLVSDAPSVLDDLRAVLDDGENDLTELADGPLVRDEVAIDPPDLVISDLQVGQMGGVAICYDLRLEASAGRAEPVPVLLLLDRRADVFIATEAGADGYLVKPIDSLRLRRAVTALLDGGTYYDDSYKPVTLARRS